MSVYMTISLTMERYLSVVHPFLALRHQSNKLCFILAAPGIIFSILFTLPNYFILKTENIPPEEQFDLIELLQNTSDSIENGIQPAVHLVWANWRYSQAYTTVSRIGTVSFKYFSFSVKPLQKFSNS